MCLRHYVTVFHVTVTLVDGVTSTMVTVSNGGLVTSWFRWWFGGPLMVPLVFPRGQLVHLLGINLYIKLVFPCWSSQGGPFMVWLTGRAPSFPNLG